MARTKRFNTEPKLKRTSSLSGFTDRQASAHRQTRINRLNDLETRINVRDYR